MSTTGLQLHDAALAVASDGSLISVAPSIVRADPTQPALLGQSAAAFARVTPRLVSSEHWARLARDGAQTDAATLAVAGAELRERIAPELRQQPLQCAVSAAFSAAALGVVLAIARREGLEIRGFHDTAALAVASLGITGTTIVLELGLGHLVATRVEQLDGEVRRRAAVLRRGPGMLALQQAWLRMVSEAMVLRTRFDPLHDGASEQRLYDALDAAAATAAANGSVEIGLPTGRDVATVVLSRDQFAEAATDVYGEALAVLHELRPAGARVNLLVDDALLRLPGLSARLAGLRGTRLLACPPGLAAKAASLAVAPGDDAGTVALQRGYALAVPLEPVAEVDLSAFAPLAGAAPTHALWEGRAFALPRAGALEIGRDPAAGGIRLAEGLAGVSRLHCALRGDAEGVVLVPHSPQGTWLNDERVHGRIRVHSGDRLRVGTPGVAIELIAVGGAEHGATQG
jgi:hypothetical protein